MPKVRKYLAKKVKESKATVEAEGKKPGRKSGKYSFAKNPMSSFRGNKTTMKRPSGRKR
jgi:hypothetical protein